MPCMYFSDEKSNLITIDDPNSRCIRVNAALYAKVQNNNEQNIRVFLDTHLLRIRNYGCQETNFSERLVSKSDASVSLGTMPFMPALVYITSALMTAEFREMTSDELKESYLAPLDNAIKESGIKRRLLLEDYAYPRGYPIHMEDHIQRYFNGKIADSLNDFYEEICSNRHYFGQASIIRTPLVRSRIIKPDIIHIAINESATDMRLPEICFAIGDYKKGNYNLARGFEDLKVVKKEYNSNLTNHRQLRLQKSPPLFPNGEWTPRVLFALVLRRYLYDAFLCGTDRVFISDHQTFSGFFKYEIVDGKQMTIDYYVINDPETVAHGITLRSAIAGFFYKNAADAFDTKDRLATNLDVASNTGGQDPFANVFPRGSGGYLGEPTSNYTLTLPDIEDKNEGKQVEVFRGNTICRIIYDAAKHYVGLKMNLPSIVFVKLYHYSSRLWEGNDLACFSIPEKKCYYDMFFNELVINEKIAKSQFAANFPKLLVSGYWNGLPDHPMHIFESLGKGIPITEWNMDNVYEVIKSRLEELHLLGISHSDVRLANIHVSVSGKVSLIDFGLSDGSNNEERKKNDFQSLHDIFGKHDQDGKYGTYNNSSDEMVFDEMSIQTSDTRTTKEDIISKELHR